MSKERKQLYEGMYILSATLSEETRQKALEKITSGIGAHAGEIHKIHDQGRRKLAYEIDKRREGYYYLLYFSVAPAAIAEMWKECHLNEDLIRFMTLRAESVLDKIEFKALSEE